MFPVPRRAVVSAWLAAGLVAVSASTASAAPIPGAVAGPPLTCATATGATAVPIATDAAVVYWTPVGCPDYVVYAYSPTGTAKMYGPDNQASIVANGLTPNSQYTFTVLGYDGSSWLSWSAWSAWIMLPASSGLASAFDGQTLNGWNGNPAIWSVKNGAIDGNTQSGGQLIDTTANYGTFRIIAMGVEVSGTQHLGVCFWGGRPASGWGYNGCIDVIPPDGSIWDYGAGRSVRGAAVTGTNHFLQWNTFEILANIQTGTIQYAVNGVQAPPFTDPRVRNAGPIGLQIHAHASEVLYKGIYIDPAPASSSLLT